MFCGSTEHMSSLCKKYSTLDSRIQCLETSTGQKICRRCVYPLWPCWSCRESTCKNQSAHGTSACPVRIKKSAVVSTYTMFSGIPTKTRAVALQTLVMQGQPNSTLPEYEKNVQILLDVGAQRSLVTKACASRLGLVPVAHEMTSLKGYGQRKTITRKYDIVQLLLYKSGYIN